MRVIAGAFKGRMLEYPPDVRPTMQRTKSSIFGMLGPSVNGSRFIDLYAAAGGMGLEALSRGADFVCFVERDRRAVECLSRNLDRCGVPRTRYSIHAGDALSFVEAGLATAADVIYADPPYEATDFPVLLELLAKIVYPGPVLIIIEHPRGVVLAAPAGIVRVKEKSFGQTHVTVFRCEGNPV